MGRDEVEDSLDERLVRLVRTFEHTVREYDAGDLTLLSFTVRLPAEGDGEYLLVARVDVAGEAFVCFRNGDYLAELLVSFIRAIKHGSLKLREDKYAN